MTEKKQEMVKNRLPLCIMVMNYVRGSQQAALTAC